MIENLVAWLCPFPEGTKCREPILFKLRTFCDIRLTDLRKLCRILVCLECIRFNETVVHLLCAVSERGEQCFVVSRELLPLSR